MILVTEHKLADFISPPIPDGVLEASGVDAQQRASKCRRDPTTG